MNNNIRELWRLYCKFPNSMEYGNKVELLVDGEQAYPAMLTAIENAEKTILMDSYIFNDDLAGNIFAEALMSASRRGVKVYLIVDAVGVIGVSDTFFHVMKNAGVKVLKYRSLQPWRRSFGFLKRNHRKMLVTDNRIGFVGGINIGDEWLPTSMGGLGWHDIHICVHGPIVRELSRLAVSTWHSHGNEVLDPTEFLPQVSLAGTEYVSVVGSLERRKRKAIRGSYLQAIKTSKKYIYIANAYFLPDMGFRRALRNAVQRGVDVRIMVPEKGDILPFQLAGQALFARLLKMGIRIFLWNEAVLHAKTAVIDDQWATVGSFNIDHRSWSMNLEVNVNVMGVGISSLLRKVFTDDQKRCVELTLEQWKRRPLIIKFAEAFFYLFRKWM